VLFNFAINVSDTIQSFLTNNDYVTIYPNQAVDISQIQGDTEGVLKPIGSFLDFLDKRGVKKFHVHRSYAAGDILILIPVIRALRKQGYSVYLRTSESWRPILDLLDVEMQSTEHGFEPIGWGIDLDGTLEADHYRKELSVIHRCDIYAEALGMKKREKLDWSMNLKKLPETDVKGDYVVFQYQGSTKMKQLSVNTANWIIKRFGEKGINVVVIGEENRKSIKELFAIIKGAKCLITMDSSPNWIAHFLKVPTIVLFGPTRPHERLIYHPLYPERAVGIELNKYLNPPCKSCFEQVGKCGGRMNCLHLEPKKIFDLIYPKVKEFIRN